MFGLPPQTPPTTGTVTNNVPGFNNLSRSASGIVSNLTGGLPSASPTQRASAFFGASSGMPGSDFIRNRGFDLYGQKAEEYKQRGFDDFLNMLKGYSGTVMPTTGEQLQNQQFNARLAAGERESDADMALKQQQQYFDETRWGKGRAWNSTANGDVFDRTGKRLGFSPQYVQPRIVGV